ncbi:MAG: hypothetical protein KJ887_03375 [Candidatus Omnitrophica bacterium]|nr:hypothetical protein [Candidatus Omnitrophota bacterium]MBU1048292.1 hypothetical protein [Candidatus Omnitrophota bacterium]MBU1630546.1 hypothetical protein [Candidatus Omnitrophota bacterium]MBU1767410.1 hypothetical protein [Candidatus Omnitrophota bacterium]MBU1888730.1 hypothetical protein [Candidatus Omnitrophota bacterium]
MTPNPILKVLLTFQKFGIKSLLIGGQACIIYGAAEFSRDTDFLILCETKNLNKSRKALTALKARNIYFPSFKKEFLDKGHACHFRCHAEPAKGLRIDLMSKLRGCDSFEKLWERRHTLKLPNNKKIEVIGLEDLVRSKKTQRDKDWLMLNRLVENDIFLTRQPSCAKIEWWLLECRNAVLLTQLAKKHKKLAEKCIGDRPLLRTALKAGTEKLQKELSKEEERERRNDKEYWQPLRRELEILRHKGITDNRK